MERLLELQAVHPSRAKDTGLTRLGPPPRGWLPVSRARLGAAGLPPAPQGYHLIWLRKPQSLWADPNNNAASCSGCWSGATCFWARH